MAGNRSIDTVELKQLIINELGLDGVSAASLADDEALFGGDLGLDSVDALELVVLLEKRYGITIQSHEMEPEAFSSAANLCAYINAKRAGAHQTE